jgi:hypothetical protein
VLACVAGLRRRIEAVNLDQGSSVPPGFVFQLSDKLTPSHIAIRFSKPVVLDHVLDSQTLQANHLVFVHDAGREFLLVVTPTVMNTGVDCGNLETGFVSVLAPLSFLGMPSLSFCQAFLMLGKKLGIANRLASREDDQRCESQVKTDHVVDHWQGLDIVLDQNGDKIAVGAIFGESDRTGFGIAGKVSMPVDIQGSIHFCQSQGGPIPLEGVGSIGGRLSMLLFLEGWVLGAPFKEVLEGCVQVAKGLLKRHAGDISKPRILFLKVR